MDRRIALIVAAGGVVISGLVLDVRPAAARPEYTRRTKKECLYCHPSDSFRLTEPGEYYRDHRTLDGYKEKEKPKMVE